MRPEICVHVTTVPAGSGTGTASAGNATPKTSAAAIPIRPMLFHPVVFVTPTPPVSPESPSDDGLQTNDEHADVQYVNPCPRHGEHLSKGSQRIAHTSERDHQTVMACLRSTNRHALERCTAALGSDEAGELSELPPNTTVRTRVDTDVVEAAAVVRVLGRGVKRGRDQSFDRSPQTLAPIGHDLDRLTMRAECRGEEPSCRPEIAALSFTVTV